VIPNAVWDHAVPFIIIQFAPGGPVERMIAELMGQSSSIVSRMGGGGGDTLGGGAMSNQLGVGGGIPSPRNIAAPRASTLLSSKASRSSFGFDKPAPERFYLMMKNFLTFNFGKSYFRDVSVLQLIKEKLPVSISLGIWMTLLTYLISIPLGIRKAVKDGEPFDTWSSAILVIGYAIPGFLFAVLLLILFAGSSFLPVVPVARAVLRQLGSAVVVRKDHRLPLAPCAADDRDGRRLLHGK